MLDRVRGNPLLNSLIGRLAGSARVSSIWVKTITDYQTLLLITCGVAFLMMGVMMGPMYASIPGGDIDYVRAVAGAVDRAVRRR